MLAYGVVFVLLIGEIDLSIGYVSGVAGMIAALLAAARLRSGRAFPGGSASLIALALHDGRSAPSRARSSR